MKITVLESGCCGGGRLESATRQALGSLGLEVELEVASDLPTVMSYGVMSTPALVVDGEIQLAGYCPSVDEIAAVLSRGAS